MTPSRHKWIKDDRGKYCVKCGSRLNKHELFSKYIEVDKMGVSDPVSWYPRCFPNKKI